MYLAHHKLESVWSIVTISLTQCVQVQGLLGGLARELP